MKSRKRCLRPPAMLIVAAAVLFAEAAPAITAETAYLMYIKGSEGPPATPFRVLWDEIDEASGRITIDLGAQYEQFLNRIGLVRVLKYDAKREKAQFMVRNPDLTRFVKTVSTSIIQGLLAKTRPGAWARPAETTVHDAALSITAAPGKDRLEVITWLHVAYPEPQNSGPPQTRNFIKGDLVFVGGPESPPSR